ncbi:MULTISPECIES: ATP-dependent DNA ligase [unclassified Pseudoclavibacter]|uniref:DUF7882 family protein n=1 Tax=unclassified Pseudoclavibacter TaxID=2615177 RepID=UPI0011AFE452|nr:MULTISPECIES: ATP-dependent DNA ligase [unclassified Pseudoclavibacter]
MGFLYYGSSDHSVEINDRALAHLKIAMTGLLRAGQSFAFSHPRPVSRGGGRETLWISPSIELRFRFLGSRLPNVNADWLRAIIDTADSHAGMRLTPEPQTERAAAHLSQRRPPAKAGRPQSQSQLSHSGGSHGSDS